MEVRRTSDFDRRLRRLADPNARARVVIAIQRMEDGNVGDCRTVGGGVFESRIHFGPGYRVYFARRGEKLIVLLLCGDKSSQRKDIAQAKQLASEL